MTSRERLVLLAMAGGASRREAERLAGRWDREIITATLQRVEQEVRPLLDWHEEWTRDQHGEGAAPESVRSTGELLRLVTRQGISAANS